MNVTALRLSPVLARRWFRLPVVLGVALLFSATSCRKRPPPESSPQPGAGNPGSAPVTEPTAAPADTSKLSPDEVLHFLNDATRNYFAEKGRLPASLEELYQTGHLKQRFNPPPGRRFVINPQSQAVELR